VSGELALAARGLEVGWGRPGAGFTLRVAELPVRAGEALAVLGPNGSGKSTLLRALAGLAPLRAGAVERGAAGETALVFQRPIVVTGSVAHNAELPLWARGVARSERRRRAGLALAALGIADLAARRADTLSGGELRRLALARAFVTEPAVLLLDEPFDDLDEAARSALSADLRRAVEERGLAAVLVTHDLRQALLLADRVAVLCGGRLLQLGPRDEVLRRPATVEVARLVGMANLFEGRVLGRHPDGRVLVELSGGARIEAQAGVEAGSAVWAGIRPECVKLEPPAHGAVPGRGGRALVSRIVSDGVLATAWLAWSGLELRTHLVAGRGLGAALKRGDAVWLTVRPEDVHVIPRGD
jgi:ABC-type Fe3+/spermidine/putrescine transport system ATPase subunit